MCTPVIYIYIYIEREREREREIDYPLDLKKSCFFLVLSIFINTHNRMEINL